MIVVIVFCLLLTAAYTTLMILYIKGWNRQPVFQVASGYEPVRLSPLLYLHATNAITLVRA